MKKTVLAILVALAVLLGGCSNNGKEGEEEEGDNRSLSEVFFQELKDTEWTHKDGDKISFYHFSGNSRSARLTPQGGYQSGHFELTTNEPPTEPVSEPASPITSYWDYREMSDYIAYSEKMYSEKKENGEYIFAFSYHDRNKEDDPYYFWSDGDGGGILL